VTVLDPHIKSHRLALAIDSAGGLLGEWERTCGEEAVHVVIARWEGLNGIIPLNPARAIDTSTAKQLRQLGFGGTIDRLILRIALVTTDHVVVSNDGHFWCPGNPNRKGDRDAPVTRLCRERLGVQVMLLSSLLAGL
jgi:hypothetical protein